MSWAHNRRGEVYTEQASAAQQRGETNQAAQLDGRALADFEAAIQLDGARWKSWHNRGVSHAIAGKYEDAIRDFSKAIELNATYANAWFNRGEIRFDLDQITEALRDYTEAIRLNPKDAGAYTSRGHAHFRLERYDEALADYDQAIQLAPRDAVALANRGDAYQSLAQWQQAAADLKRAIDLGPDSSRVLQSAAWLMATCPDAAIRNAKLAVEAAEKSVELAAHPDARHLDTLAAAYANAGRFKEAAAKIKDALRLVSGEEAAPLQRRLELYQQQQPYRQGQANKSAALQSRPKAR
jgi:tetratricopeptide (TPR) repeat protein